jgi:hypothetical protein
MGRAFGELDAAFYDSGRVMSQRTCVVTPLPRLPRSKRHASTAGQFTAAGSLGVPECIEIGGYYAVTLDSADDLTDYVSYEVDR